MRALREFVENSETCISLAKEVSEIPLIQGVHVEPHPWLLRFWVAARNGKYPRDDNSYRFDDIDIFDPTVASACLCLCAFTAHQNGCLARSMT